MKVETGFSIDFLSLNIGQSRVAEVPKSTASDDARLREQLVLTRRRAGELTRALNELDGLLRVSGASRVGANRPATATSTADLGLDGVGVATTLQSSNEVNTTPTSFSTFGPDWIGSSAQASLAGTYDGSNGTDTLTFRVDREGVHGADDLRIKVYDSAAQQIDQLDIKKNDLITKQYTLSNGVVLTLGAGELFKGDSFTLDVDASLPTSFAPSAPAWTNVMALVTIDGVYDGSNGNGTLRFDVTREGTHGSKDLQIKVYDPNDQQIDTIDIDKNDPINTQYTLVNGMVLSLGAGDLVKGRTLTVDVYDSVGSVVDPDKPLDGTRTDNPSLEYGLSVTPGTFQVNGVTIDVLAADTMNSVLNRITQSAAGVSATFDPLTETVVLTQTTTGQTPTIVLANDTSGFVQAMKLDSASPTLGVDPDPDKLLTDVPLFASIQSGTITVEGVDISIDVATDSLNDVIARINASVPAVVASISGDAQRVSVTSTSANVSLEIDSGNTGFFPVLQIADGSYLAKRGRAGVSTTHASRVAESVESVSKAFNALYDDLRFGSSPISLLERLRSDMERAVSDAFADTGPRFGTDFGVGFDFRPYAHEVFEFSAGDKRTLASTLRTGLGDVHDLFLGQKSSVPSGLVEKLTAVLNEAETNTQSLLGFRGHSVDVLA